MEDRCVCCGAIIPEGRQVCPSCEKGKGLLLTFDGATGYFPKEFIIEAIKTHMKRGEWIKRGNEKKCSNCQFIYYSNNDEWTFCPNCGAKMKDGE